MTRSDSSFAEQRALFATLERSGASLYRSWAAQETQKSEQEALLTAAVREEENASLLEEDKSSAKPHR